MPSARLSFETVASPSAVLATLNDLEFLAAALPGVVKIEKVDERTALWTVRLKVGFLERTSVYRGEILRSTVTGTEFRAVGPEATVHGTLSVLPGADDGSKVTVTLDASGVGPLRTIVDNILAKRLPTDVEEFARRVRDRVLRGSNPP